MEPVPNGLMRAERKQSQSTLPVASDGSSARYQGRAYKLYAD